MLIGGFFYPFPCSNPVWIDITYAKMNFNLCCLWWPVSRECQRKNSAQTVYFSFSSFVALLKLLAGDHSACHAPSSLPHTFPLAIRNYHTVWVQACPKATAGLIFFGLALLWHAWEGQGKEMGGPVALCSPRAVLGAASPVFLNSTELVRERGPCVSNKSFTRLCNWNCVACAWSLVSDEVKSSCGYHYSFSLQTSLKEWKVLTWTDLL